MAAQRIIAGEGDVYVAGGVESISCVQQEMNQHMLTDSWLLQHKPEIYWTMLQTAETVAKRYGIAKERQDELRRGQPAEGLRRAGSGPVRRRDRADAPSPPAWPTRCIGHAQQARSPSAPTRACARARRYEGIQGIRTAVPGGVITAGNASQFSDGAGACVVVSEAYRRAARASSRWAASWALPWPAASPTRWASARCSPCPRCWHAWA
jgi:acetyl-CoA C-acetyltransferase